jgi:hypothetical protein
MKGIIDQINADLDSKIAVLVELVLQKEELEANISVVQDEVKRLRIAYDALNGSGVGETVQAEEGLKSPPAPAAHAPPPPVTQATPVAKGPPPGAIVCNSCDGYMYQQQRTLQSGRTVTLWACSECSNERV